MPKLLMAAQRYQAHPSTHFSFTDQVKQVAAMTVFRSFPRAGCKASELLPYYTIHLLRCKQGHILATVACKVSPMQHTKQVCRRHASSRPLHVCLHVLDHTAYSHASLPSQPPSAHICFVRILRATGPICKLRMATRGRHIQQCDFSAGGGVLNNGGNACAHGHRKQPPYAARMCCTPGTHCGGATVSMATALDLSLTWQASSRSKLFMACLSGATTLRCATYLDKTATASACSRHRTPQEPGQAALSRHSMERGNRTSLLPSPMRMMHAECLHATPSGRQAAGAAS